MTTNDELWDDVSISTSASEADEDEHRERARQREEARAAARSEAAEKEKEAEETLLKLKKALRITVPNPLTSLWLGKVEKKEHAKTETFEGLRGYSSEDIAMLAEKDIAIGAKERVFVDAADELLMLAGFGPKMDETNPAAAEEVRESVEKALDATETAARAVEYIGMPLAKLGLLATGFPFPAPGALGKFKAAVWSAKVANWGWGAYKSGRNFGWWGDKSPGVLGLFASDEILQGAKSRALIFAGESFGAYAGKSAEIAASGSAELIGGVLAEVLSGGIAELKGGVSAEVVGGAEAALKSVWGTAEILGRKIEIGRRSPGWTLGQKATEHLELTSTHGLELSVGPAVGPLKASVALHEQSGDLNIAAENTTIASTLTVTQTRSSFEITNGEISAAVPIIPNPFDALAATRAAAEQAKAAAIAAAAEAPADARWAADALASQAYLATTGTAFQTLRTANHAAILATENQPAIRVTADGVTLTSPLAKLELLTDGTVRASQKPATSIELSGGAIKIKSAQMVTIEAAGNTWTFGPAGLTGPGVSGA